MADNWPSTLPGCFILGTHSDGFGDGLIRSTMDTGPAKVRRRSSAMPRPMSGTLRMTGAQIVELRTFISTTLIGGALAFNFPDQRGGSELVRFSQLPSWTRDTGDTYIVQMALEVLP